MLLPCRAALGLSRCLVDKQGLFLMIQKGWLLYIHVLQMLTKFHNSGKNQNLSPCLSTASFPTTHQWVHSLSWYLLSDLCFLPVTQSLTWLRTECLFRSEVYNVFIYLYHRNKMFKFGKFINTNFPWFCKLRKSKIKTSTGWTFW